MTINLKYTEIYLKLMINYNTSTLGISQLAEAKVIHLLLLKGERLLV